MPGPSMQRCRRTEAGVRREAIPALHGIDVGFSSLCVDKPVTYDFVFDVIGELARLTPGPFIHIGGDEAAATRPADYVKFVRRVQQIVESNGKRMIGWEEIGRARLDRSTVLQHWKPARALDVHAAGGPRADRG